MKYFLPLFAACALSLLLYLVAFGLVLSRPMVIDSAVSMFQTKLAYARQAPSPKIVILADSNARFSHSCATIEAELHRPCANMGVAVVIGLGWATDKLRPVLRPGDIVYLPLEFGSYSTTNVKMLTGVDAAHDFRHDKRDLFRRNAQAVMRAAFLFDLSSFLNSLGEMLFQHLGGHRRIEVEKLDRQGDQTGHDDRAAAPYALKIRKMPFAPPDAGHLIGREGAPVVLAAFLDWCRSRGVKAVGGLPTVFDDRPMPDAVVNRLRDFYAAHGAGFLVLPNRSQYPRSRFFDSEYHLRQPAQIAHSRQIAGQLRPYL